MISCTYNSFAVYHIYYLQRPLILVKKHYHVSTSSGSDHTKSQNAPLWGISWFLSNVRIWSIVFISGLNPPCTQRIFSSISYKHHYSFHNKQCGIYLQQQLWANQKHHNNTSKHSHFHISSDIHRKNRTPVWSVCSRDCL